MKLPSLATAALSGKRVLVRVGFDVPVDSRGKVLDRFRIERSLPTIQRLLRGGASVMLLSHRGQPHGKTIAKLSLRPVGKELARLLRRPVSLHTDHHSVPSRRKVGQILLLENLRFDLREERKSMAFARELATLGDYYVNDDFSTSHRDHTSLSILPQFLPHAAGLNLTEEVGMLERLMKNARHPFYVVLGGAKVEDKLGAITKLLPSVDGVFVGGAAASTLLKARGYALGRSLIDTRMSSSGRRRLLASKKVHLPVDVVVAHPRTYAGRRIVSVDAIPPTLAALDLGPLTAQRYATLLRRARTVFWAGALGLTEQRSFCVATRTLANALPRGALSIAGGGDTIHAFHELGLARKFSFLSTGGGATLRFLSGGRLPGLDALRS